MESGSVQAPSGPPASLLGPGTDLVWNGSIVKKSVVAAIFFGASLAIIVAGLVINYELTDGAWQDKEVTRSPFGTNPSYLTTSVYDLTTFAILLVSLVLLGIGFVAAFSPQLRSRVLAGLAAAALLSLAYGRLDKTSNIPGESDVFITLGIGLGLVSIIWVLASFVGSGARMHLTRAAGFVLFGFYWATQAMRLYATEDGDFVNAIFAGFSVLFFNYFAYHELLSIRRNEDPRALHWLAGAAFLTTGLYVATHKLKPISEWLILTVAEQTTWLLEWFGHDLTRDGGLPDGSLITYDNPGPLGPFPIQIILACTAIQSIMIFVGGILALRPPSRGDGLSGRDTHYQKLRPTYDVRRFYAMLLTIPLIYVLNLFRNVIIISMSANGDPVLFNDYPALTNFVCDLPALGPNCAGTDAPAEAAFWFSHNIIGKGGSLLALVIIAFMVFQVLPELYDSIIGLMDLSQRQGPLERWWRGSRPTPLPPPPAVPPMGEP